MRISRKKIVFFWGGRVWRGERGPQQQQRLGEDAIWGVKGLEWSKKKEKSERSRWKSSPFSSKFFCVCAPSTQRGESIIPRVSARHRPSWATYVSRRWKWRQEEVQQYHTKGGARDFQWPTHPKKKKCFSLRQDLLPKKFFCVTKRVHSKNPLMEGTFIFFYSKIYSIL